ncbi:MAG: mannonate dehydratase [bacterium]|nr:mannonate dehydratase [bacterium]
MRLTLVLRPLSEERLALAKQIGVTDIDTVLPNGGPVWEYQDILHLRKRIEDAGLIWSVVESVPISDRIKLDLPGWEEDLDAYCQTIRNLGAAGIPIMCYNWMAAFNWMRTSVTTRTRGGALVSRYDHHLMEKAPLTEYGNVSEDLLWKTFERFLKRVIPVAEEAGVKQALHPDDPPLSPIRGIGRIITSVDAFQRVMDMVPSEYNGITFCQGNFASMGVDVPATIRRFGDRIHFAHFRDVKGTVPAFEEAFHDDGDTDMAECMRAYRDVKFTGPIRPDHVPTLEGEPNDPPGYTLLGRLYAIGYMRGLIDGTA